MADATAAVPVIFHRPKAGSTDVEWEDCAGHGGDPEPGRAARYVVVDGATEAFDSLRWVRQLVRSFLGDDGDVPPALDPAGLDAWFGRMQQRWVDEAPREFANIFAERKFREQGSFATFLGCDVHGLGGPRPYWSAAALGDAVLFHVRRGQVVGQLPGLAAEDFGLNPDGVFTDPSTRERMRSALRTGRGELAVGDRLFLATDALAEWLARTDRGGAGAGWDTLAAIEHPREFRRFVAAERNARRMKNDDVTLLRVGITAADADVLVVCR